jgi:hypothetical protein
MEPSQHAARAWRKNGQVRRFGVLGGAMVLALASAWALSGCYYRGRPPERGGRGYGEHDRGRGWHDDRH